MVLSACHSGPTGCGLRSGVQRKAVLSENGEFLVFVVSDSRQERVKQNVVG